MARPYVDPVFYVQMGNKDHLRAEELFQAGFSGGAVLSPRHETPENIMGRAQHFLEMGKEVFYDPQLYNAEFSHREGYSGINTQIADDFANFRANNATLSDQLKFQRHLGVSALIVPTPFAEQLTDGWLGFLRQSIDYSLIWKAQEAPDLPVLLTIAASSAVISDPESRARLLDTITGNDIDGFYLVCGQNSNSEAFPTNEAFLEGQMDLVFRLKQNRFKVIMGYSSYQSILFFPLGIDGFCSGTYGVGRVFDIQKWTPKEKLRSGSPKPRFTSPELLSTFVFPDDADLLFKSDVWRRLGENQFSRELFDGNMPSSKAASWKIGASFKHYLASCHELTVGYSGLNRQARIQKLNAQLDHAILRNSEIAQKGIQLRLGSQHVSIWQSVAKSYLAKVHDDLVDEFN
jgi:hypothetical protein